ncbi:thiaminase II [Ktedonosporobacter rubrisoli]|uniref:Aminopyrimidine aminohydrolase n=1 Tax=Ktedonosporobacter rubrisoli TaxID=2509675 RepID=A0A4P6JSK2_KTERU|nr:thiaminase II [Ktedonosporobacter rubrisoli]QBD77846.1 thiaminase II [Ktedonosporobacter rubrisoli]
MSHTENSSAAIRSGTDSPSLSERLRQSVLGLWQRQLLHPFVVALGDGSLPQANFEFYIRQDARFLDVLIQVFAYAITKTTEHSDMEQLGKYVLQTLLVEADLHRRYGERFGLSASEMANTPLAPSNYAYTRHLLSIATTGTLPEVLTSTLPCAWLYADVGRHLVGDSTLTADHPYADWLATYASPDFDAVEIWIRGWLDEHAATIDAQQERRLQEIFTISTRYEWMFWDMAWKLEVWPS